MEELILLIDELSDEVKSLKKDNLGNILAFANDYKMFGEESYVFVNKEYLHKLYETYPVSMNDLKINREVIEYIATKKGNVGFALANVHGIEQRELLGTMRTMTAISASQTAMTAISASQTAMTAISASQTAMTAISASQTAMTLFMNNSNFRDRIFGLVLKFGLNAGFALANCQGIEQRQLLGTLAAMQAVAGSETAMQAVAGSETAMQAVAGSETAMQAVAGSETAMQAVAGSETAMQAVTKNYTALKMLSKASDEVLRSSKFSTILYKRGEIYYKNIFDTIQANRGSVRVAVYHSKYNDDTYNDSRYSGSGDSNRHGTTTYSKGNGGILRLMGITNIDSEKYHFSNLERIISGNFSNGGIANLQKITPVINGSEVEGAGLEMFAFGSCSLNFDPGVYPHYYVYELD